MADAAETEKLKALCAKQQQALKVMKEKLAAAEASGGGGGSKHSDEDYDKLKKMVNRDPSTLVKRCALTKIRRPQAVALKADREKLQAKIKELEESAGAAGAAPVDTKMQEDFEKLKKMVSLYPSLTLAGTPHAAETLR